MDRDEYLRLLDKVDDARRGVAEAMVDEGADNLLDVVEHLRDTLTYTVQELNDIPEIKHRRTNRDILEHIEKMLEQLV